MHLLELTNVDNYSCLFTSKNASAGTVSMTLRDKKDKVYNGPRDILLIGT